MKVGTRSVLFGVHCFWYHPLTVILGWWLYHGRWPAKLHELLAIFFHDIGYIGCSDMDGPSGLDHPERSCNAMINWLHPAQTSLTFTLAEGLILGHSRSYAAQQGIPVSSLYAPDKLCVLFDPSWFYILRATLSGEINEFIANSRTPNATRREWLRDYKAEIRQRILQLETL